MVKTLAAKNVRALYASAGPDEVMQVSMA